MTGNSRKNRCLSPASMDLLLDYVDMSTPLKFRTTILIHLLAGTGLKVNEATSLKVDNINTATGYLTAGRSVKRRDLPMDERTLPLMQQYLSEYRARLGPQCASLLVSHIGTQLSRPGVLRLVRAVGRSFGLELTPETIRRSYIRRLSETEPAALVLQRAGIDTLHCLSNPGGERLVAPRKKG